jgi:AdoMet-dependent rRNA methyltransferase SPB1
LFKKITLEQFVDTESPYAVFVDCNEIEVTDKDREKFFEAVKPPQDFEEHCKDLLLLGKREISLMIKWRAKIRNHFHKEKKARFDKIAVDSEEEEEVDPEQELYKIEQKERRAQEKLKEKKILQYAKQASAGSGIALAESDLGLELADFDFKKHGDIIRKGEVYTDFLAEEALDDEKLRKLGGRYHEYRKKEMRDNDEQEVEDNLEFLYEMKRQKINSMQEKQKQRELEKEKRKTRFLRDRDEEEEAEEAENALKMDKLGDSGQLLRKRALDETGGARVQLGDLQRGSKWFDRDIFSVLGESKKKLVVQDEDGEYDDDEEEDGEAAEGEEEWMDEEGEEELVDGMDEEELEEGEQEDYPEDGEEDEDDDEEEDEEDEDDEDDEDDGDADEDEEEEEESASKGKKVSSSNGNLRALHNTGDEYEIYGDGELDEEEMLKDMESKGVTKKDMRRANRLKMYEQMEKEGIEYTSIFRKKGKKEEEEENDIEELDGDHLDHLNPHAKKLLNIKDKKEKRANSRRIDDNRIEVVPAKKFEDFDVDELAEDLALAKKMIRKKDREEILDMSFNKHCAFDYEGLPSWFVEDEKKHHFINIPITKEEVKVIKDELKAINEKPAKKILEAKFRKKRKLEKQLRKFKKQADQVFDDDGLDDRSKAREVRKLKHKIVTANKSSKPKKKVIVGKKFKVAAPGKKTTGKNYAMVDRRSKKELKAEKRRMRKGKNAGKRGKRY